MNNEIFIDDIDDYDDFSEECLAEDDTISKWSIAIFGKDSTPNGSGVLINNNGIFISAAHIFKNDNNILKAWFDDQIYEIEIIYKEYESGKYDFLVGKLKDFQPIRFCELPILKDCVNLSIESSVFVSGFKRTRVITTELIKRINIDHQLELIKQRQESKIVDFHIAQKNIPIVLRGDCLSWRKFTCHAKDDMKFSGFSGGPVYFKDKLYGVVLSNYFLKSDYIMKKLDNLHIDYRR